MNKMEDIFLKMLESVDEITEFDEKWHIFSDEQIKRLDDWNDAVMECYEGA